MPRKTSKSKSKLKKTSPFGIFAEDPSFFSHFLIKQERGESAKNYLLRYVDTCLSPGEDRWQYFTNPVQAKAIFFLVGLRNRWLAREVYAWSILWQTCNLPDILSFCRSASCALVILHSAQRSGSFTTRTTKQGLWKWAQYRPNTSVYHLELLRYQLLTGKSFHGNFPQELPTFDSDLVEQ